MRRKWWYKAFAGCFWGLFCLSILFPIRLLAEDSRTKNVRIMFLIDTSPAMGNSFGPMIAFLKGFLKEIGVPGDRIGITPITASPQSIGEVSLTSQEDLSKIFNLLDSIQPRPEEANYRAALEISRQFFRKYYQREDDVVFTILIMGTSGGNRTHSTEAQLQRYLQYSVVEDHPGWKLVILSEQTGEKARQATQEYARFLLSRQHQP
ncbi:VWA domain-containing protein [Treponema sp. J25]|uniref:vWA domain-containing protein n=1 Tax=Treponema sp. J25 TaxID=2094121 RepID=UPI00104882A3|nr:VWA domain-containing protein [Treponema sp. J25]TCW62558.1 hypothetical protein C5O22_00430 [Treponema sp. J25]